MSQKRIHREEILYLPALTHDSVLIAWGAFFFEVKQDNGKEEWKLIDDDKLPEKASRRQSIGASSEPYGKSATVFVTETNTRKTISKMVKGNHAMLTGLKPDTEYSYRVEVEEGNKPVRQWASGPLLDWDCHKEAMLNARNSYDNRFRTFPAIDRPAANLTFAVIGDFGRGVRKPSESPRCQQEVAEAMLAAYRSKTFQFILTTGDNIYAKKNILGLPTDQFGNEDDDWFYTYFQPYRYLLNRLPVYAAIGNHDTDDNEHSVDRDQIVDNLYLQVQASEMKLDAEFSPGLLYRFRFGSAIEFVCLDSSKSKSGKLEFEMPEHQGFMERAFAPARDLTWRIPYSHHPAYCAGPQHGDTEELRRFYLKLDSSAKVRATFSGHEHNIQFAQGENNIDHIVTGGGGKFREKEPKKETKAKSYVWGGNTEGHFLLVEIVGKTMTIHPYGHLRNGELRRTQILDQKGNSVNTPLIVKA